MNSSAGAARRLGACLSSLLPLLLLLQQSAVGPASGSAQPAQQAPAYLDQGVETSTAQQVVLQLALVSARAPLAFVRPEPPADAPPLSGYFPKAAPSHRPQAARCTRPAPGPAAELLAVEGATLRLNFVILVSGGGPPPASAAEPTLRWTHNGHLVTTTRARLSQQLVQPEYFNLATPTNSSRQLESAEGFVLAPHVDERQLGRLERSELGKLTRARKSSQFSGPGLADDFLSDGQAVDKAKLEAYLHFNSAQLGLQMDCGPADQLHVVQAELGLLQLSDGGPHALEACVPGGQAGSKPADCATAAFLLQVALNVPRLESRPESQVLEPGERLSIKCAASGFTLPQITWYLDGVQLNEQQLASDELAAASGYQSHLGLVGSRLRVGDYVSQNNQVHSFVNASQVGLGDGGSYRCQANNGFHSVEHETRVIVRGPPTIARQLANRSGLAGASAIHVQCPYSGHPITTVEWYFRPEIARDDYPRQLRAKRRPEAEPAGAAKTADAAPDGDMDPDKDDWLSQASAMTSPPSQEDYPDPLPEYPTAGAVPPEPDDYSAGDLLPADYEAPEPRRRRRDVSTAGWLKFPQSRRHQVHSNGTLVIQELAHADQGFYKCRVLGPPPEQAFHSGAARGGDDSAPQQLSAATSNEFHLTVLVAPVISPFSSAESLREGMRNFLTCSVIEGDSPVRLRWLKDATPIEDYIAQATDGQRIRVEASNEYTSTLYFSHVDFRDNGNYTCMATNKAASVNYTAKMLVNVPPKWISAPKDLECVAGQSIVIDCQAEAHPAPRVWWEIGVYSEPLSAGKDLLPASLKPPAQQHHYAPNHYRTIISNSRIHILENASLVIRDVHRQDQGYYLCQAANNFGSLSSLIKLTVNVGASFSSKYLTKYVKLNERVELDCDPVGQAPVDIVWYMRRSSVAAPANQLNLTAAAVSQAPSSASSSAAASSLPLNSRPTNQSSAQDSLGRRLFIGTIRTEIQPQQQAAAGPPPSSGASGSGPQLADLSPPETTHLKQEQVADLDSSMSSELIRRPEPSQSELVRLVIKAARRVHSADFVCQASNRFGSDEKLIKLQVQEAPDPVVDISAVQVDSRSISLVWLAPHNGNSPIVSYLVEWAPVQVNPANNGLSPLGKWSHLSTQQPSAFIGSLQPLTIYEVRVRARNQLGESPLPATSPPTLVTTAEEAPTTPPGDIRALPLSSTSIQLSWAPPAQSSEPEQQTRYSIKGYYLGYRVAGSNESFVFKTVSLLDGSSSLDGDPDHLLALPASAMPVPDSHPKQVAAPAGNETAAASGRLRVVIDELRRSTRYAIIVQAFNSAGPGPQSDLIEARTLANDPPPAPQLRVGMVTFASIELQWSFLLDLGQLKYAPSETEGSSTTSATQTNADPAPRENSVDGYHLYFRSLEGEWQERRLMADSHTILSTGRNELTIVDKTSLAKQSHQDSIKVATGWQRHNATAGKSFRYLLDQLACGNSYQIYMVAYNSIGASLPSQILRTKTRGSAPIAPRKQDYIVPNSTHLQLNLDAWMDGGCSLTNFEVRYRQLSGPRENTNNNQHWLVLSSQLSPSQRLVEVRDLQPETWYAVQTSAESAAGKTQVQHTLMTLDKFGQLPPEALEPSNLPALFRSNSPLRSMWQHLAATFGIGHLSPLFISALLFLVMFATCSLLFIRRYGAMMKTSASLDSSTHTASAALGQHYGHSHHLSDALDHSGKLLGAGSNGVGSQEQYSMKASPCKTSTTCMTSSSTSGSAQVSSSMREQNPYCRSGASPTQLDQFVVADHSQCVALPQYNVQRAEDHCSNLCESSLATKFATLNRVEGQLEEQVHSQPQQSSRFRTMPHRPVSTFIAPSGQGNYQQAVNPERYLCDDQQRLHSDYQQQLADQAIYSKLRLIYNSGSNYNLYGEEQKGAMNGDPASNQIYNGDAIGLALLAQQQHQNQNQKMLTCTLGKRGNQMQNVYVSNGCQGAAAQLPTDLSPGELTSLLMGCQQQQQQQQQNQVQDQTNGNYGQFQVEQRPLQSLVSGNVGELKPNGYGSYGAPSIASGSTSASNSTQPTSSSSMLLNSQNDTTTEQLVNLANGSSGNNSQNGAISHPVATATQCLKSNLKVNGTSQQPQANEPNDYALPFPPKWV